MCPRLVRLANNKLKHILSGVCLAFFLVRTMTDFTSNFSPELIRQAVLQSQAQDPPQQPPPLQPPLHEDSRKQQLLRAAIMAVGAGLDIDSTHRAMQVPGMAEQNSWLYGKHPSLGRLLVTKAAYNLPLLWASHKITQEKGPVEGLMPVIFPSLVQGIAGGMNYKKIDDVKKYNAAHGGGENEPQP